VFSKMNSKTFEPFSSKMTFCNAAFKNFLSLMFGLCVLGYLVTRFKNLLTDRHCGKIVLLDVFYCVDLRFFLY